MYNFIFAVHIVVVIGLITIILIQRGRSGGLVEALGGVESIFGTKTSNFLVKATVTLVILFFLTSISLVYFSKQRSKSLIEKVPVSEDTQRITEEGTLKVPEEKPVESGETPEPAPGVDENTE